MNSADSQRDSACSRLVLVDRLGSCRGSRGWSVHALALLLASAAGCSRPAPCCAPAEKRASAASVSEASVLAAPGASSADAAVAPLGDAASAVDTQGVVAAGASVRPLRERIRFGAYAPGLPYETAALYALEGPKQLGRRVDIASGFVDWDYVFGGERDRELSASGARTLLYSWEPHCRPDGSCIRFRDVFEGRLDAYLTRVAESMKAFPYDLYVRPWGEMNASWSPWRPGSSEKRAGSIEEFKQAWRYLHGFFRTRGVHNLKFVFNPDASMEPTHVPVADLWPGTDPGDGHGYVDVLGIDGYNWGESGSVGGNTWQEFDEIFGPMYNALTALDPKAPVWVCEVGSKEPKKSDGSKNSPAPRDPKHDKAAWLRKMMQSLAMPRLTAVVYFDTYMPNRDNQRDWRFASSAESLQTIREELSKKEAAQK